MVDGGCDSTVTARVRALRKIFHNYLWMLTASTFLKNAWVKSRDRVRISVGLPMLRLRILVGTEC